MASDEELDALLRVADEVAPPGAAGPPASSGVVDSVLARAEEADEELERRSVAKAAFVNWAQERGYGEFAGALVDFLQVANSIARFDSGVALAVAPGPSSFSRVMHQFIIP